MNILYLSAAIVPSHSANSVHVMKMCSALAENGHDVKLVATNGKNSINCFQHYNVKNEFRLCLASNLSKLSWISRIIKSLRLAKEADIIYARWPLIAWIITKIFNKKIIFEYHAPPTSIINKYLVSSVINSSKVIRHIFITNALKDFYCAKYPLIRSNSIVLPDGADPIHLEPSIENNNEIIKCGYLGSFQRGKGIELILQLAQNEPNAEFHIIGGSEKQINQFRSQYASKNIIWYGFLNQKEAMKIMSNVNIALLPNQPNVLVGPKQFDIGKWTSPMKMFEYMALGKAIIASDLAVLKEILDDQTAILVPHDNVDKWKDAIKILYENKELLSFLGNNSKRKFLENYTWKIRAQKALKGLTLDEI